MTERKEGTTQWRYDIDKKLDTILKNHRSFVTNDSLKENIAAHAGACPGNPGNPIQNVNMTEVLKQNLKPIMAIIGILGTAVTTINLLVVGLLRVLKVI
jgi:hypothetical protein